MKTSWKVLPILNTLFLVGCSTLPSVEEMQKETSEFKLHKMPSEGKAMVYVVRPSSFGCLVRFNRPSA
jgi:hypothetical protein